MICQGVGRDVQALNQTTSVRDVALSTLMSLEGWANGIESRQGGGWSFSEWDGQGQRWGGVKWLRDLQMVVAPVNRVGAVALSVS